MDEKIKSLRMIMELIQEDFPEYRILVYKKYE